MPASRFTWDHFEDHTVAALAGAIGFDPERHRKGPRAFLAERVKRPNDRSVREHKDVLVHHWLPTYPGAKNILDRLIDAGVGPMGSPRSQKGYVRYVDSRRPSISVGIARELAVPRDAPAPFALKTTTENERAQVSA